MKALWKVLGVILACLLLLLVVARIVGFEPNGRRPGLWLKGDLVTTPVADWSFTDKIQNVKIQTTTWYLLPHSVTTGFIFHDGQLYITSMFGKGVPFPDGKSWVKNVMRDPHVRLKFGDNLYDCTLSPVSDPGERAAVLGPRAERNPQLLASDSTNGPVLHLFHVQSMGEGI